MEEYNKVGRDDVRWYVPEYWLGLFDLDMELEKILQNLDYANNVYEDSAVIKDFAKNYTIIISTNNPSSLLNHKLRMFKYAECVSHAFSSVSDFNSIVKNREFYLQLCKKLDVEPHEILHIGDDPLYDAAEPRAIGVNAFLINRDGKGGDLRDLFSLYTMFRR